MLLLRCGLASLSRRATTTTRPGAWGPDVVVNVHVCKLAEASPTLDFVSGVASAGGVRRTLLVTQTPRFKSRPHCSDTEPGMCLNAARPSVTLHRCPGDAVARSLLSTTVAASSLLLALDLTHAQRTGDCCLLCVFLQLASP